MKYGIKCSVCSRPSNDLLEFKCPICGGPLNVDVDADFETCMIRESDHTMWRYARFFPYVRGTEVITLGEGDTPLVRFSNNVYFKLENLNPTGSFKDRGSAVLLSALYDLVKKADGYVSEDSSGNAGASVAAYAARSGLRARIYVPENVSGPKLSQIRFYGGDVVKVSGSRSRVTEEAQKSEHGKFYVGHVLHPLFRDGIRSLAYETAEQLAWVIPDRVYLPASAGTLLLGVLSGFAHLIKSGKVSRVPTVVACQARQVSPLYHRFKNLSYHPPERTTSIADALVSVNPPLLDLMVNRLKEADGDSVMVEEDEIHAAFKDLARRGFFVEPSSAVAYAAYEKQLEDKEASRSDSVVVVLTGSGLKTALEP